MKVLAFANDVLFLGPPKLAVAAMARWEFLYGALLQGQINQKKCLCNSPRVVETFLREVGLPAEVPFTAWHPSLVGSDDFCVNFAQESVAEVTMT